MELDRIFGVVLLLTVACDKPPDPTPPPPTGPHGTPVDSADGGGGPPVDAPVDETADPPSDSAGPASDGQRVPMVDTGHPLHGRLEGAGFGNDCEDDKGCVRGGCSSEVCSADQGVNTTCDVLSVQFPADAQCGCLAGQCQWWSPSAAPLGGGDPAVTPPKPNEGAAPSTTLVQCGGKTCKPGQTCVEYYGIAGTSGPKLRSCEWRCSGGCPKGTKCVTVADGPGKVCR